jgi:hypothetical protein
MCAICDDVEQTSHFPVIAYKSHTMDWRLTFRELKDFMRGELPLLMTTGGSAVQLFQKFDVIALFARPGGNFDALILRKLCVYRQLRRSIVKFV